MFTEQPAPPNPVVHVQPAQAEVVVQPKVAPAEPVTNRVAAPETIPPQAPTFQPAAEKASNYSPPSSTPASPPPAPAQPTASEAAEPQASSNTADSAKARRQQEVEQTLLELTSKARAQQKEQQQQQAATEAAKYSESGDFKQAEQAAKNPALPANLRQRLLKQLQAKQAKKNAIAARKPSQATAKGTQANSTTPTASQISPPEYSSSGREEYTSTPIIPLSAAELRARYGKLIGRNLDFAYPLTVPAPITSLFGWRIHPISGSSRFHRGLDLGAPYGTPVVAAKTGRVEVAGDMSGYGLTVMVRHNTSQQTLYAHLSQIYVKPGEMVKKGQLLGLVGSTGNSTGPHLHFELHQLTPEGWTALDPAIALNPAISLAENPTIPSLTKGKPQAFNLALSGLLDINAPPAIELPLGLQSSLAFGVSDLVSATLTRAPAPFRPFSLLPTVLPELSWLLSPFVDNWLAKEPSLPSPLSPSKLESATPTVSFNPVPTLAANLPTSSAFKPASAIEPKVSRLQLATTQPIVGLKSLDKEAGNVRLTALTLPKVQPKQTLANSLPALTQAEQKALLNLNIKQRPYAQNIAAFNTPQPRQQLRVSQQSFKLSN